MPSDAIQRIIDADEDAISFSGFMTEPSDELIPRRLAPPMNTLNYYRDFLHGLELVYSQQSGYVDVNGVKTKTVSQALKEALDAAVVGGGGLADTAVATVPQATGQIARTQSQKNAETVSVKDFGAIGDNTAHKVAEWMVAGSARYYPNLAAIQVDFPHVTALTDYVDWATIQKAIDYVAISGGTVNIPQGNYTTNKPLIVKSFVDIKGATQATRIKKLVDGKGTLPVDCIMYGYLERQFDIGNLELVGNRTNKANGNIINFDGVYFDNCNYFNIEKVRAISVKRGYVFTSCWVGTTKQTVSLMCQEYGYNLLTSCTSMTAINHTNWGTGGGYRIASSQYTTIICPANDHIDYGGLSDDPFLPQGSGGNHLVPNFLFEVIGSQVTIISAGMENSATQYLYCEGGDITMLNPVVFTTVGYSQDYKYIQLRGTAKSTVRLNGANRFFNATIDPSITANYQTSLVYVEDSTARQLFISDSLPSAPTFGDYAYNDVYAGEITRDLDNIGIICSTANSFINLNQKNMMIGGGTPFITDTGTYAVSVVGGKKVLTLSGDGSTHRLPLMVDNATLKIRFQSTVVAAGAFVNLSIVQEDGTVLKNYVNDGTRIDQKRDVLALASNNGTKLYLQFKPEAGQSISIETLNIERVY